MKENVEGDGVVLSRRYLAALRKNLEQDPKSSSQSANRLGSQLLKMGLETLDVARLHEECLIDLVPLSCPSRTREELIRGAEAFFIEVVMPIEKTHSLSLEARSELDLANKTLDSSTIALADSDRNLKQEMAWRKATEVALKKSKEHYGLLLEQSSQMQDRLRKLSREVLTAQEDERRRISRELHDVIGQALTGIQIHLATLESEASVSTQGFKKRIANTQRLVTKSVECVHRFALELRPSLLDDLGLVPALRSHVKGFAERTGIRVDFSATAKAEGLDGPKQTVLYRVAQEALTNVAKHAKASQVNVRICKIRDTIRMEIRDNGISFDAKPLLSGNGTHRLGLIGMRERVEMVEGRLCIESEPGEGTLVRAEIPFGHDGVGA